MVRQHVKSCPCEASHSLILPRDCMQLFSSLQWLFTMFWCVFKKYMKSKTWESEFLVDLRTYHTSADCIATQQHRKKCNLLSRYSISRNTVQWGWTYWQSHNSCNDAQVGQIYLWYFPRLPSWVLTHFPIYQECLSVSNNNKRHPPQRTTRHGASCEMVTVGPPSPCLSSLQSNCQKSTVLCIECFN